MLEIRGLARGAALFARAAIEMFHAPSAGLDAWFAAAKAHHGDPGIRCGGCGGVPLPGERMCADCDDAMQW